MPEQKGRKYDISDANMLTDANNKRAYFIEDQADFTAFDPDFANPYETDWETKIEAAETYIDDETVVDQMVGKTEYLHTTMKECRDYYQNAKHFIEKAFPNNVSVQGEFGFNDYEKARQTQPKMVLFMYKFHAVAVQYSAELIAKNYTQAMIDGIELLADKLKAANIQQDTFIGNRGVKTQTRSELHNAVWDVVTYVCKTGKLIYKNNYAKYNRYLLPSSEEPDEELMLKGFVTDSLTNLKLDTVTVAIQGLGINTQTDSLGKYGFGLLPPGTYTLEVSKPGYTTQIIPGIVVAENNTTTQDITLVPAATTGTVSGNVQQTAINIPNAFVSIDGFPLLTTTTDINGNYTLNNVPAGMQVVRAQLPPINGGASQTQNVNVVAGNEVSASFMF
ncbi:MAG TPA: carboxypeptidase-like regulatory domain-containing protein [Bacteroidia bacterium]|nr:carboxypeptidase-like regulatory domain-containing protein [Bacteroidia bacterium]